MATCICLSAWNASACIKNPPRPCGAPWSSTPEKARRDETFAGDANIFDADGTPVAEVKGLMFKRAGADALKSVARKSATVRFHQVAWKPLPLKVKRSSGVVGKFADRGLSDFCR